MSFGQLSDPRLPSFLVTILVARYHPLMFRSSPTLSPLRLFTSPSSASHPPPLPPIPLLCLPSPSSASHPPPLPPFPLLCLPSPSSASLPSLLQVVVTQIGTLGTMLYARREQVGGAEGRGQMGGMEGSSVFNVSVLLGRRDEPLMAACARHLIETLSQQGVTRPLLLCLGLKSHTQ
ncbi:unnamed protein product, partial [Closterium sp. NIES-53]